MQKDLHIIRLSFPLVRYLPEIETSPSKPQQSSTAAKLIKIHVAVL